MQLQRILLPTDFSDCANAALDHAVFLARQFRAELHLLHVVVLHGEVISESTDLDAISESADLDMDELHSRLERIVARKMGQLLRQRVVEPQVIHQAQRRAIAAAPAIVEYAASEAIDLIVAGTHGRRGLRRCLLGSVAEEVVRTAPCPVMTLRDEQAAPLGSIRRIVVPFDFSSDAEWALSSARGLAQIYGSRIDLLHVISPVIAPNGVMGVPSAIHADFSAGIKEALAQRAAGACDQSVGVESHVFFGVPAWRISDFAEEVGADLIVMGSHGLGGLRRFLLGSVSERVVRSARCPVLVLRRPEDAAQAGKSEDRAVALVS